MSQQLYKTRDIGEAAALLCHSTELAGLEKSGSFFWFVFSDINASKKIASDYWFHECNVNAKSFHEALKTLKNRLFAGNYEP